MSICPRPRTYTPIGTATHTPKKLEKKYFYFSPSHLPPFPKTRLRVNPKSGHMIKMIMPLVPKQHPPHKRSAQKSGEGQEAIKSCPAVRPSRPNTCHPTGIRGQGQRSVRHAPTHATLQEIWSRSGDHILYIYIYYILKNIYI